MSPILKQKVLNVFSVKICVFENSVLTFNPGNKSLSNSKPINDLKSNKCVKKFDVRVENLSKIKKISDKETVNSLHLTSSTALLTFLENENESIF